MTSKQIAFLGATGDCAGFCLANALKAGYNCTALARTPQKLSDSLIAKGVSEDDISQHLTIVEGNAKDIEAMKKVLTRNNTVVDLIVSGIGGTPTLQWSLYKPVVLTDPRVCLDAGTTVLHALAELKAQKKPVLINVSTTGINPPGTPNDVPLAFNLLYHWMLQDPHEDKLALERHLGEHVQRDDSVLSGHVQVKASLLMNGESLGLQSIRQGIDEKPAVGYTIRRSDVGLWMFEKLIKQDVPREWINKGLTITY
ncbi:hypothetical protein K431DRAFT_285949 [Polychaeton citri CBS 116435]|uniref:NAD(P)-binding domain-containing protein n=1 Tax=Polychaeton citri CBS 116435 TaxID=1314669 RepID=A0A9P4UN40_9PEZI|nr:hypothetical protein K431DRAFT_285949 [Polychaeton citri CBS 116435]